MQATTRQKNSLKNQSGLTVRKVRFDASDVNPRWTDPIEFSWTANAISLMMPYVEPFFVDTISEVLPSLPAHSHDEVRKYMTQEANHHAQHRRFNQFLTSHYGSLRIVERQLGWLFGCMRNRKMPFRVAFTAASETIAYAIARWAAKYHRAVLSGGDQQVAHLFLWHLAEEVEHKNVAFDIQEQLAVTWFKKLQGVLAATAVVMYFTLCATVCMAIADKRWYNAVSWFRLAKWSVSFAFELLPLSVLSLGRSYSPRQLVDPLFYQNWLKENT